MNATAVLGNWLDDFTYLNQNLEWGVITYTFHPFVIGRGHRMVMLEKLIHTLQKQGAVFMTLEDAAVEYQTRANALVIPDRATAEAPDQRSAIPGEVIRNPWRS